MSNESRADYKLWLTEIVGGFILAAFGFLTELSHFFVHHWMFFTGKDDLAYLLDLVGLASVSLAFCLYFIVQYQFAARLRAQADWGPGLHPLTIVLLLLVPLLGLYILFNWCRKVDRYVEWRVGGVSRSGLIAFALFVLGFICFYGESNSTLLPAIGDLLLFSGFAVLFPPLRAALAHERFPISEVDALSDAVNKG